MTSTPDPWEQSEMYALGREVMTVNLEKEQLRNEVMGWRLENEQLRDSLAAARVMTGQAPKALAQKKPNPGRAERAKHRQSEIVGDHNPATQHPECEQPAENKDSQPRQSYSTHSDEDVHLLAGRAVKDDDWGERYKAIKVISFSEEKHVALDMLIDAIHNECRWDHRRNAVQALAHIFCWTSSEKGSMVDSSVEVALIRCLKTDARREVRYYSAQALESVATHAGIATLAKAVEMDDSKYVREVARKGLDVAVMRVNGATPDTPTN